MKDTVRKDKIRSFLVRYSWPAVAAGLILFPPAGVILLAVRALLEKRLHEMEKDRLLVPALVSLLWGCFSILLQLAVAGSSGKGLAPFLFPIGFFSIPVFCGVLMLCLRQRYKRLDEKCRLCLTIVNKGHLTNLEKIGECLCASPQKAGELLEWMIKKGLLNGCQVDYAHGELRVQAPWAAIRYVCNNCGAELVVNLGADIVCGYCGSPIRFEE